MTARENAFAEFAAWLARDDDVHHFGTTQAAVTKALLDLRARQTTNSTCSTACLPRGGATGRSRHGNLPRSQPVPRSKPGRSSTNARSAGSGELGVRAGQEPGGPGLLIRVDGEIDGVLAVRVENGHVTGAYHVRNPEELSGVEREIAVSR
ncbi:hypothetical protein [Kibdelosporangium phytohabitans]|uniref:Uncharacterized protein n=1 Tax=Kibdelosporangium phytohabitans TaxID=860235 RepID=A0A0N9HRN6_9PSEU|nr:hypothetical protein [Kibdelosporangium phytohabitans]ALG09857.1 hypothetical protein AOZ06_25790 [Kibdelosporangium phytohabitans]MBE1468752.1 hypothetical protein [Kibdelosporangium phytohabitans]